MWNKIICNESNSPNIIIILCDTCLTLELFHYSSLVVAQVNNCLAVFFFQKGFLFFSYLNMILYSRICMIYNFEICMYVLFKT